MRDFYLRAYVVSALLVVAVAACSGTNGQQNPQIEPQSTQAANAAPHTYRLSSNGVTADLTLRTSVALADSAVSFRADVSTVESSGAHPMSSPRACPAIPPIKVANPFPFPITIRIVGFTVHVPCTPQGSLFGATLYQIVPQPTSISPTKIGDATANGQTIDFVPVVKDITFPANTVSQIVVLPETSTSAVAFPVVPGATTNLTTSGSNLPSGSGLTFTYATSTGATIYSAACFNAFDNNALSPTLAGVPLVGTPSFFCQVTPANNGTITFGNIVTFNITLSLSDAAIFEPDGQAQGFACTTSNSCNVPQFSVPTTYQTFISSNVQNLRICAPATPNTDCNNFGSDPQSGSRTTVPKRGDFQVLVADDPTYKPGTAAAPVPWSGLFSMALSGPCRLDTAPDNDNGDAPPGYTDDGQQAVGPAAELDVTPTGSGTCTITATEDPKYIVDYSNPSNPVPRSVTLTLTIGSSW